MSNDSSKKTDSRKARADSFGASSHLVSDKAEQSTAVDGKSQVAKSDQVTWNGWVGIGYAALVFFAAQFVASFVLLPYVWLQDWTVVQAKDWLNNSVVAHFWFFVVAEALTFAGIWWFVHRRRSSLRAIGFKSPRLKDVGLAVGGIVVYYITLVVIVKIVQALVPALNLNQDQDTGFQVTTDGMKLLMTFVSLVILPPLVEETVFRGFVFSGLRAKLPFVGTALITSVLFGAAHLQQASGQPLLWLAAIDTFTLSMFMCYLRERTGSIWPGIFMHATKNGIAFYVLFITPLLRIHP